MVGNAAKAGPEGSNVTVPISFEFKVAQERYVRKNFASDRNIIALSALD
jgi:hypothetical protein